MPDLAALASRTEALLAAHVPLSLLLDLADPLGPDSAGLFAAETGSVDWVLPRQRHATRPAGLLSADRPSRRR